MLTEPDLTLYRVTADDGQELLILGRDDADVIAAEVFAMPSVVTVGVEPLAWGSLDELDVIAASYFNGVDLSEPVAELARAVGADFDPSNFDPAALLLGLRERVTLVAA